MLPKKQPSVTENVASSSGVYGRGEPSSWLASTEIGTCRPYLLTCAATQPEISSCSASGIARPDAHTGANANPPAQLQELPLVSVWASGRAIPEAEQELI